MTKEQCDFYIEPVVCDWSSPAVERALGVHTLSQIARGDLSAKRLNAPRTRFNAKLSPKRTCDHPESETATSVFMCASYNYALNNETVAATLQSFVAKLVDRDTVILEDWLPTPATTAGDPGLSSRPKPPHSRATHRGSHARQRSRPLRASSRLGEGEISDHHPNTSAQQPR